VVSGDTDWGLKKAAGHARGLGTGAIAGRGFQCAVTPTVERAGVLAAIGEVLTYFAALAEGSNGRIRSSVNHSRPSRPKMRDL